MHRFMRVGNVTRCKEAWLMMAANDHDLEAWLLALPAYLSAAGSAISGIDQDMKKRYERIWILASRIEPDMARVLDWWQNDALVALEGLTPQQALESGQGDKLENYLSDILADR